MPTTVLFIAFVNDADDNSTVLGIFSSKDKARHAIEAYCTSALGQLSEWNEYDEYRLASGDWCTVDEYQLDAVDIV